MLNDDSFRIRKCMEETHTGYTNVDMIVHRAYQFIGYNCQQAGNHFPKFAIEHQLLFKEFVLALEDPLHPGYMNLSVFASVLLLARLDDPFWKTKKELVMESTTSVHQLRYASTLADLLSYHNRYSTMHGAPPPVAAASNSLTVLTAPIIPSPSCILCKKPFVPVEMLNRPGTFFKTCKPCGMAQRRERDREREHRAMTTGGPPSPAAITAAQKLLARLPTAPPSGSILVTSVTQDPPPITLADVSRLIAESQRPTFGNFVVTGSVTSNYILDNAASLSTTSTAEDLISYTTCHSLSVGAFGGEVVQAIGFGFLPNFHIPDFKVYFCPMSTAKVLSIGQLTYHYGCKAIQEGDTLTMYGPTSALLCTTTINSTTLHHHAPSSGRPIPRS